MKQPNPLDQRTPRSAVLSDGLETWFVRYASTADLMERLAEFPRRALDGALRIGPQPGLNRPDILELVYLVRDRQIAAAAARLHAQRATARRQAEYGGNRGAQRWLKKSGLG